MDQSVLYSILCFCVTASIGDDVILKPLKQGQPQVGMVFIQGFEIKPEQYIPLATAIQNASNYSLWVGIPDFTFDIPEPIEISEEVERIIKSLQMTGMNTTSIFFAAHSLGGIILQNYIHDNPSMCFCSGSDGKLHSVEVQGRHISCPNTHYRRGVRWLIPSDMHYGGILSQCAARSKQGGSY